MEYLTVKDAAKKWKSSEQMIRRFCRQGRIPDAIQNNGIWQIPCGAAKPDRTVHDEPEKALIIQRLLKEKSHQVSHALYDYIQINFCYSSNRLASNRLMRQQVEEIFKTGKVKIGFEPIKVDDLVEAKNHIACVDYIIDTADLPLSPQYIKQLHLMMGAGTLSDWQGIFRLGEYRNSSSVSSGPKFSSPKKIASQIQELTDYYEGLKDVGIEQILDFHVRFEKIRPFEDANGRIGRLIMFKECLRNNIIPFIIDDKRRAQYLKGLKSWSSNNSILINTCLEAQHRLWAHLNLLKCFDSNYSKLGDLE